MPEWNAVALGRRLPRINIDRAALARIAGTLAFVTVTLFLLHLGNELVARDFWSPHGVRLAIPLAAGLVSAGIFHNVRYAEFSSLLRACTRASAIGLIAFLVIEAPDFSLANPEFADALTYVQIGYWVALACAVASLFRPAFIIPVAIYILSTRLLVGHISGLPISIIDIRYMLDMALYLAIFGIFAVRIAPMLGPWFASPDRQSEIVGVAMGLHLANYFWSGIAKLAIGPTPWYWIFENQTSNQIPYTLESGILPIGHIPWLTQLSYDVMSFLNTPLNAAIVVVQLFAIICVLRVGWLKIASLLFDALHIGIYIFGGLFFWPWIWNNVTVWWAARSTGKAGLSNKTKLACIATMLLGFPALNMNPAAWLAWYDVADARQIYFEAVKQDGTTIKVPSAFFITHSYSVSHGYMGYFPVDGQYEATPLASTETLVRNEKSGDCVDPRTLPPEHKVETADERNNRQATLGRFLASHHAKMLDREASVGRGSWYVHAHHHPSNPFLYDQFNNLNLRDVVGYNLVLESDCLSLKNGKVQKKVVQRDTEYYDVG
ncbi:MAG: hypothetical protein EON61_15690 [Alphaproteobacteria bacterium]|nr:MAG: hypothetical protein EON61_15690 [Alphaproteobacteria bacterium]